MFRYVFFHAHSATHAVVQVLLAELGPDAEDLFSQFDEVATAAASLAQVGRGRGDGRAHCYSRSCVMVHCGRGHAVMPS